MERYQNNLQDQFGNAISGVTVTVRDVAGGALATLYSDDGVTGKANPFTNDADGEFFFYAANDRYNIFFTGPITDQKDDVLLQDIAIGSVSGNVRIISDTNAPAGPTGQVGTATLDYYDSDESDRLAQLGFIGGSNGDLRLRNDVHSGHVQISASQAAGTEVFLVRGDPDGYVSLYYLGVEKFRTHGAGIHVAGGVGSDDPFIGFYDNTLTSRQGFIQCSDTTGIKITGEIHGATLTLESENLAGTPTLLLDADPDSALLAYYAGTRVLGTLASGIGVYGATANGIGSAQDAQILLYNTGGTNVGDIGYPSSTALYLRNLNHGGAVIITAEDAGGTPRTILSADPDSTTTLIADTDLNLQVKAGETAVQCVADGKVGLRYNNIEKFRTVLETDADQISGAEVLNAAGVMKPIGLGVIEDDATAFGSGAQTPFQQINAHECIENDETVATSYTTYASTGSSQTNIPAGAQWEVKNTNTGALTILGGTGVTLTWFDGAGAAAPTGTRTLARAGRCVVRKISDTNYEIWGIGLT